MSSPFDITDEEINRALLLHPPQTVTCFDRMDSVRKEVITCVREVMRVLPPSKEKSIAFTKFREALMYSVAALACNQEEDVDV